MRARIGDNLAVAKIGLLVINQEDQLHIYRSICQIA